ncbi:ANKRD50 [Mytilus coruscus]|uniref:ANKRD50 n=1 Tax=Mytilus coruscus TaxID=42192 RepID=A0A6J8A876_MYTCO|nr:ANKRD50 [Mytilus coruscus]
MNIACENGYEHITKLLLTTKQYDVNRIHIGNQGWTNLMFACKNGHFEIVAILMNNGADSSVLNDESETAFNIAYRYDNTKIVEYFLENGSNINGIDKHGLTSLISACKMNHFMLAKLFISRNAKCDKEPESGMTPIGAAWSSKSYGIVDFLLQNRAIISEKDLKIFARDTENGSSNFFQMASKEGYKSVPEMLSDY